MARNYLSAGLATTLAGAYARADVAHDTAGGSNALEFLLQDNIIGVSLSADSQLYRSGFISEFTETIDDPVTSRTTLRADAPFKIPLLPQFNVGISDSYVTYTSERVVDDFAARVSTSIDRVSLSHVLTYRTDTSPAAVPLAELFPTVLPTSTVTVTPFNKQTTGEWIVSVPFNRLTLRGDMLYGIEPQKNVQTIISAAEYAVTPDTNTILQIDRQMVDQPLTTYTVTLNRRLDRFLVGASASHSDDGKSAIGFNISLAIGENPRTGGFEIYPDNTARDGIVVARAFHDGNGNGVLDNNEAPIENVHFRVNHGNNNTPADQEGAVLLRNIPADTRTSLTLDGNSLENPYLLNNKPGFDVVARAGVPVRVDFPVSSCGDVEGTAYLEKDGVRQEAANVTVQVITGDGKVVKEVRTSFDGYYLDQYHSRRPLQPARLARAGKTPGL